MSLEKVKDLMMTKTSISFYEDHDGIYVVDENLKISITNDVDVQSFIFGIFPMTKLKSFKYTSKFNEDVNFKCFSDIPETLEHLYLSNYSGISDEVFDKLINQNVSMTSVSLATLNKNIKMFGNNIFSYTHRQILDDDCDIIMYHGLDDIGTYATFSMVDGILVIYNGNGTVLDEFLVSS